ncbi:MAG: CRISPR-associated helicase Cas3', partial [Caldisericum sp.]
VLNKAKEGKRVLVIANTVKQAQKIFQKIKKLVKEDAQYEAFKNKIWLLHSQFTQTDRNELEEKICSDIGFRNPKPDSESEGKILVATQVVEVSLDIDADILFTEIAPLDALVQRMGRVLRRYGPMTSPDNIPPLIEPNVFVWVFRNGIESGNGKVYDRELVRLSLAWLLRKQKGDIPEVPDEIANKGKGELSEFFNQEFSDLLDDKDLTNDNNQVKGKKRLGKKRKDAQGNQDVLSEILEFNSWFKEAQLDLSEYDKYKLVLNFYKSIPEDSRYLTKFYKTKDILDAGYMSDRKEEAEKLFREIHTISIIPEQKKDEFLETICKFFNEHNDCKRIYTYFKQEVLSKFIVHIPRNSKQLGKLNSKKVETWLMENENKLPQNSTLRKRLLRWCKDIYFAEYEYNQEIGISVDTKWEDSDPVFL